jgi:hypothetical protein
MIKATVLLDQCRTDWKELNCLWSKSGMPYEFPELVGPSDQSDCYLVIAAADLAALAGLALVRDKVIFDSNKPVIWIDHERKVVDVFGCTSQLAIEIRKEMRDTESSIRRLMARLLVS